MKFVLYHLEDYFRRFGFKIVVPSSAKRRECLNIRVEIKTAAMKTPMIIGPQDHQKMKNPMNEMTSMLIPSKRRKS